jgi:hypothetical protein
LFGYLWLIDGDHTLTGEELQIAADAAAAAGQIMHRELLLGDLRRSQEQALLRDLVSEDARVRSHAAAQFTATSRLPASWHVVDSALMPRSSPRFRHAGAEQAPEAPGRRHALRPRWQRNILNCHETVGGHYWVGVLRDATLGTDRNGRRWRLRRRTRAPRKTVASDSSPAFESFPAWTGIQRKEATAHEHRYVDRARSSAATDAQRNAGHRWGERRTASRPCLVPLGWHINPDQDASIDHQGGRPSGRILRR